MTHMCSSRTRWVAVLSTCVDQSILFPQVGIVDLKLASRLAVMARDFQTATHSATRSGGFESATGPHCALPVGRVDPRSVSIWEVVLMG